MSIEETEAKELWYIAIHLKMCLIQQHGQEFKYQTISFKN